MRAIADWILAKADLKTLVYFDPDGNVVYPA